MKQGFLTAVAIIGYGLVGIIVILAVAIGIIFGVKGFGPKDELIVGLEASIEQSVEDGIFVTNNKTINISSQLDEIVDPETETSTYSKTFKMSIKGTKNISGETVDYSSQKVNLVLTKSERFSDVISKTETPLVFVTTNEDGEEVESVTLTVQVNEEFTLKLVTYKATNPYVENAEEKDYVRGGDVYLQARTANNPYKANPQKIQVDVPVETLAITAKTYNKNGVYGDVTDVVNTTAALFADCESTESKEMADTSIWKPEKVIKYVGENTSNLKSGESYYYNESQNKWEPVWNRNDVQAFIKNSEIQLGVKTFPENAVASVAGMSKLGFVEFSASRLTPGTQYDPLLMREGIFKIYADGTTNTGDFPVSAKIPALYKTGKNYAQADYINASDIVFRVEPVEVESITIQNSYFKNFVDVDVYGSITFSATALNERTNNMDIKIKSKHFVHGEDPSQANLSNIILHSQVSSHFDHSKFQNGYQNVFNILSEQLPAENNRVWTLVNLRDFMLDETMDLYFSFDNEFDENSPNAHIQVVLSKTLPTAFEYTGETNLTLTKQDAFYLEVVEGYLADIADRIDTTQTDKIDLDLSVDDKNYLGFNGNPTYKKWIYFAKDVNLNTNDVGSRILNLSSTGQILYNENNVDYYSQKIEPLGAGNFDFVAMLVLTNKDGDPVDCYYNPILNRDDTGFVLLDSLTAANFDTSVYAGKFVVVFVPIKQNEVYYQRIKVTEKLTNIKAFYDDTLGVESAAERFGDIVEDDKPVLLPLNKNQTTKTLYLVGNSCLALENISKNYGFEDPFAEETQTIIEASFGAVTNNDNYSSELGNSYKIRYVPLTISYLGFPKDENPDDFDINFRNNPSEDLAQREYGILNCSARVVNVDSIDVTYNEAFISYKTVTEADKDVTLPTLKLKSQIQENRAFWYFYGGNNESFGLNTKIDYTYNIAPAHDYTELHSTKDVVNEYQIFALTDHYLIGFCETPNEDYDKENYNIYISKKYDANDNLGLQVVLKENWEKYISNTNEKRNIMLVYSVRAASDNAIVATKCFLLDFSDCADGVVSTSVSQKTTARDIDFSAEQRYSDWTYTIFGQTLSISPATSISVNVDYGVKKLKDVIVAGLNSSFEMSVALNHDQDANYTTQPVGRAILETGDKFAVVVKLFYSENVVYEFDYQFKLSVSNVYKVD